MSEKYQQAFVREVMGKNPKGKSVRKGWQLVLKYKEPNPQFIEKPAGTDTRMPSQKRREVWKQITKVSHARTKTAATKELQLWREQMEAEANAPKAEEIMLLEYIEEYVSTREAAMVIEASTAADYRHTAKRLAGAFSGITLSALTPSQMQKWEASELRRGVSTTTVGKAHRLLKQVLKYALVHEDVSRNIMDAVEPPKRTKNNPNGLTIEEAQRVTGILLEAGSTPVATAAFLALHAGLRAGECCGLKWSDVDLDACQINVRRAVGLAAGGAYVKGAKTNGSTRTVDIDTDTVAVLKARKKAMRDELKAHSVMLSSEKFEALYVCGTIEGSYLNPQILSRKWSAIAEERHIIGTEGKRATFHTLRHAYATVAIATNQADVASIAAQMGHSNITQTLNTYTSALASGKRNVAKAIGDAMHPTNHQATISRFNPTGTEG